MGKYIKAYCKNCDFTSEFNFGGNRIDYKYTQNIPAINTLTNEFEVINVLDSSINIENYLLYNNENLQSSQSLNTIKTFDYILKTDNNICPKCRFRTFFFKVLMLTD